MSVLCSALCSPSFDPVCSLRCVWSCSQTFGSYAGQPASRSYVLQLVGVYPATLAAGSVTVNGAPVPYAPFDRATGPSRCSSSSDDGDKGKACATEGEGQAPGRAAAAPRSVPIGKGGGVLVSGSTANAAATAADAAPTDSWCVSLHLLRSPRHCCLCPWSLILLAAVRTYDGSSLTLFINLGVPRPISSPITVVAQMSGRATDPVLTSVSRASLLHSWFNSLIVSLCDSGLSRNAGSVCARQGAP